MAAAVTSCQTCFPQHRETPAQEGDPAAPMGAQSGWEPPCLTSSCSPFNCFSREAPQPVPAEGDELCAQPGLLQQGCLGVPTSLPSTCSRYVLGSLHSPKLFSLSFQGGLSKLGILRLGLKIPFVWFSPGLCLQPGLRQCELSVMLRVRMVSACPQPKAQCLGDEDILLEFRLEFGPAPSSRPATGL